MFSKFTAESGLKMETHARSLMKTLSWRMAATSTTIILVFLFTGNLVLSAGIGFAEAIIKTLIYYLHERMWNKLNFGRENLTPRMPVKTMPHKNSSLSSKENDQ